MNSLYVLAIIAANVFISVKGFNDPVFFRKYMLSASDITYRKEYYRLFSGGFLHIGWTHLLFNMVTLYFFYNIPMYTLGKWAFLLIYFVGLGFSSIYSYLIHKKDYNYAAVGASGAVSAVLFSAVLLHPTMSLFIIPIPIPIPGWLFAVAYILLTTYGMRKGRGNIGHSAHLGGAVIGIVLTVLMHPSSLVNNPILTIGLTLLSVVLLLMELKRSR